MTDSTKLRFGLSNKEAKEKLNECGLNQIVNTNKVSPLRIMLRTLKNNFLIYLLIVASILSLILGKNITAWTILLVVVLIIVTTFIQEYRAEKALEALKNMILPKTSVMRDGKEVNIDSTLIVPQDVVIVRPGEKVPADGRLIKSIDLRINEAVLTGEAKEVKKDTKGDEKEQKVYMGSFVVHGKGIFLVTHTGMNTEFGKIAKMISSTEKEVPLQIKINTIVRYMSILAVVFSVIVAIILLVRSPQIDETVIIEVLIIAIALMVSSFPEGFPVVLTSSLAYGTYRMAQKNAIVNRMSIIETLGETTVICADKTGTITTGKMTIKNVYYDGKMVDVEGVGYNGKGNFVNSRKKSIDVSQEETLELLIKTGLICNEARIEKELEDGDYDISGSPTEASLVVLGIKAKQYSDDYKCERIKEMLFSSERKMMSILVEENGEHILYTKGAPEIILKRSSRYQSNKVNKLTTAVKDDILSVNKKFANQGLRGLALAYRKLESKNQINGDKLENNLVFLGLVGIEDSPREEVEEAIVKAKEAGIKVKMITGDHHDTAVSIATQVGIEGQQLSGEDIDNMTDEELSGKVLSVAIFSRVRPEHKLRIVKALKEKGEIVTMTGDGVNDAPALKEAQIGTAMGANGTDVTREVADLTLKDDNFSTIITAISEGRTIFTNIRKFTTYQLSCNFSELVLIFVAIIINLPLPLVALQILFLNLITDDLPAISLGFNPPSKDVMRIKPRKSSQILTPSLIILLAVIGIFMGLVSLAVYYVSYNILSLDLATSRTYVLLTMIFLQVFNAFGFRSLRSGVFEIPFLANKYLIYGSIGSVVATFILIYTPVSKVFETVAVNVFYLPIFVVIGFSVVILLDLLKLYSKKTDSFLADIV